MSEFKVNDLVADKQSGRAMTVINVLYDENGIKYETKQISGKYMHKTMYSAKDLELFKDFSVGDLVKDRLTSKKMIVTKIIDNDNIKCRFNIGDFYHSYIFNRSELRMHEDSKPQFISEQPAINEQIAE